MKKLLMILLVIGMLTSVGGCATATLLFDPCPKTEIKNYPLIKNKLVEGNYLQLVKCWEELTAPPHSNNSQIKIYPELGIAEIWANSIFNQNVWGVLILEKESNNTTRMSVYSVASAESHLLEWAKTIYICSK